MLGCMYCDSNEEKYMRCVECEYELCEKEFSDMLEENNYIEYAENLCNKCINEVALVVCHFCDKTMINYITCKTCNRYACQPCVDNGNVMSICEGCDDDHICNKCLQKHMENTGHTYTFTCDTCKIAYNDAIPFFINESNMKLCQQCA